MATVSSQPDKHSQQQREQEALTILRTHRQQSGYAPWTQDDNDRLRSVETRQKQQAQADQDYQEGADLYHQRAMPRQKLFVPVAAVSLQVEHVPTPVKKDPPPPLEVRIDPELGRLAIGLSKVAEFRLWAIARHQFGRPGWTTRQELFETARTAGALHSRRHFNRLLKDGAGLFWGLSEDGRVWLRSYVKVSRQLASLAAHTGPALVETNIPGSRDVHLRVGGSLGTFKAQLYAGWLAHREDPKIARETLARLFNCTPDTLRNWERELGATLEIVTNYAQTALHPKDDDRIADYIPERAYSYVTRRGQIRLRWRQPNRYKTKHIRQHPHKGQSRKARTAAAQAAWNPPVEICAHNLAFDRSHRVSRRYYADAKALRKALKRLERRGEPAVTPATPRYAYRGEDRNRHGIYELSLDGEVYTYADERLAIRREYGWWKGYNAAMAQAKAS